MESHCPNCNALCMPDLSGHYVCPQCHEAFITGDCDDAEAGECACHVLPPEQPANQSGVK